MIVMRIDVSEEWEEVVENRSDTECTYVPFSEKRFENYLLSRVISKPFFQKYCNNTK